MWPSYQITWEICAAESADMPVLEGITASLTARLPSAATIAPSVATTAPVAAATDDALAGADLAEIFGVEIETVPSPAAIAPREVPVLKLAPVAKKRPMRKKAAGAAKPAGKSRKAVAKKRRKKADGARKS